MQRSFLRHLVSKARIVLLDSTSRVLLSQPWRRMEVTKDLYYLSHLALQLGKSQLAFREHRIHSSPIHYTQLLLLMQEQSCWDNLLDRSLQLTCVNSIKQFGCIDTRKKPSRNRLFTNKQPTKNDKLFRECVHAHARACACETVRACRTRCDWLKQPTTPKIKKQYAWVKLILDCLLMIYTCNSNTRNISTAHEGCMGGRGMSVFQMQSDCVRLH